MNALPLIDEVLADTCVKLSIETYNKLPKSGKPTKDEWTVVAAIVQEIDTDIRIVSLGTGSKCLGKNLLCPKGTLVNDSHAEVITRRGLLLYLYNEISNYYSSGSSQIIDGAVNGKIKIKKSVRFGFVSSIVPCGDAAIIPVETSPIENVFEIDQSPQNKRPRLITPEIGDIHRTGAKCLSSEEKQDLKLPGSDYHIVGALRTKPGRGDPTTSLSCSDKLARWNSVGIQGALLSHFLEDSLLLSYIVIGAGGPFSQTSINRAINERVQKRTPILRSTVAFPVDRDGSKLRPAASSIAWNCSTNKAQVCIEGRKLGATKKNATKFALDISKCKLLEQFLNIAEEPACKKHLQLPHNLRALTYRELKNLAIPYQSKWKTTIDEFFKVWTNKPDGLENFRGKII